MPPQRFPKTSKFWEVHKLEQGLMGLGELSTTLSTSRLKSMGIERAPQLDIDNPDMVDAHPVFFQPFPDTPEFRESLAASRRERHENDYDWSPCTHELSHIGRLDCAGHVINWLTGLAYGAVHVHNLYPTDVPQWKSASPGNGVRLPEYSAKSVYLQKHHEAPPQRLPEWFTTSAFYFSNDTAKSEGMRHVGLVLADTTSHRSKPDEALRSEITAGVSFIKRRMWASRDAHNIIPVLVYSFYHNQTVRITQVCWHGGHSPITFRQSRLVDISSESLDTPDATMLVRWMLCIPLREPKVRRRRAAAGAGGAAPQPQPADDARSEGDAPTKHQDEPPHHPHSHPSCQGDLQPSEANNADPDDENAERDGRRPR
ncbi:uncharacterized protein B0H64DRAFT_237459 [Chaetomium fimeti]|uniref:Uncharacterized protein n=1 Tax=Chaetomium fimeti TaxID=1854472 RepID=A0AAE0HA51_9PEZI|nr:hypothetical protein B0H64DRAFT_237459 [Chaetomium fimeti]